MVVAHLRGAREPGEVSQPARRNRGAWWLVLGALGGLVLAVSGVARDTQQPVSSGGVPDGAVAIVDGDPITYAEYQRAIGAVAADRRAPMDRDTKLRTLERLIDEALLVRHGRELDLVATDRALRNALVGAVISLLVTAAEEEVDEPTGAQLRAFYDANRYLFTSPGRLHVRQRFFALGDDPDAALRRATAAAARLRAGTPLADIAGDPDPVALPDGPLPPNKLREYLGPKVTEALLTVDRGGAAGPLRSGLGLHVVQVVARSPGEVQPFDAARPLVRHELVRRAGDDGLRRFLDAQRALVSISVAEDRL